MGKSFITIGLLTCRLLFATTNAAHHEAKDLGEAAANFFGSFDSNETPMADQKTPSLDSVRTRPNVNEMEPNVHIMMPKMRPSRPKMRPSMPKMRPSRIMMVEEILEPEVIEDDFMVNDRIDDLKDVLPAEVEDVMLPELENQDNLDDHADVLNGAYYEFDQEHSHDLGGVSLMEMDLEKHLNMHMDHEHADNREHGHHHDEQVTEHVPHPVSKSEPIHYTKRPSYTPTIVARMKNIYKPMVEPTYKPMVKPTYKPMAKPTYTYGNNHHQNNPRYGNGYHAKNHGRNHYSKKLFGRQSSYYHTI